MNVWLPKYEGYDHINIYSKSKLKLGRSLASSFHSVFIHPEYGMFRSIDGFYFWLLTGRLYPELKKLHGYKASEFGKKKHKAIKIDKKFKEEIQAAICYKIMQNQYIQELLIDSELPLTCYYYYGEAMHEPKVYDQYKKNDYIVHAIEEIRIRLKSGGKIPSKT